MKKAALLTILCLSIMAAAPGVPADTIVFKSGKKVDGTITGRNGQAVTVDLFGVTEMSYELIEIESINGQAVEAPRVPEAAETGKFSPVKPPDEKEILRKIEEKALRQPAVTFTQKAAKTVKKSGLEIRLLLEFLFYIYFSICLFKVANRLHDDNSARAWIPGLNVYLMFDIAAIEARWVWIVYAICCGYLIFPLWAFTGIAGLLTVIAAWFFIVVMTAVAWMRIAANMGKPAWLGILSVVPVVNLFVLGYFAFSDSRENMELV